MGNQRATNQTVFIPIKMGRRRGPGSKFKPKPSNTHMGNQRATSGAPTPGGPRLPTCGHTSPRSRSFENPQSSGLWEKIDGLKRITLVTHQTNNKQQHTNKHACNNKETYMHVQPNTNKQEIRQTQKMQRHFPCAVWAPLPNKCVLSDLSECFLHAL